MGKPVLMKGNEAVGEAAVRAGCRFFAGYPITPQNEVPEYLSKRLPEVGGTFIQAESEVAAINMVYGAGGAGGRAMTSSSSPGISLKQEGLSYMAGAQVPGLVVNMTRCGPGLGGIQPAQGDYFQATKGGGHGDYRLIVLAPASVQEAVELVFLGFDLADKYRNPVMILGDSILGQMMEPVVFPETCAGGKVDKPWATVGKPPDREPNVINSLYLQPEPCEEHNLRLQEKYREIAAREARWEALRVDDAEILVVAFGTCARVARSAVERLRAEGVPVGLFRPITLFPFPSEALARLVREDPRSQVLVVEMNAGQMLEDVQLAVGGWQPIHFYCRMGGMVPTPKAVAEKIRAIAAGESEPAVEGRRG